MDRDIANTSPGFDADTQTMKELYAKFGLEPGTQDFIGHAMALWLDDECVALRCVGYPSVPLTHS